MLKIRNIRFVGNLIMSSSYEFNYDDITMTLSSLNLISKALRCISNQKINEYWQISI